MKAATLIRTPSIPSQPHVRSPTTSDNPSSASGNSFLRRSRSTNLSLHPKPLQRARSDTCLITSRPPGRTASASHWAHPSTDVVEEEEEAELEYSGGGMGIRGRKIGGGGGGDGRFSDGGDKNRRMGDYYQEMLRGDPGNPLLLRNYGRFLHEVAGDVERAEECYGRAILASPGDGDVLSLYGGLVWEAHGDGDRAGTYFERAINASPDDCNVLGSYAKFLWDAEEKEEESIKLLVEAF